MNRVLHIGFNTSDINKAIAKLEKLDSDFKNLPDKMVKEIAEDGLTYLDLLYDGTQFDENSGDITTIVKKTVLGYAIIASGKNVIYEEFGTGEIGKENPHPEKSEYPLNDYNSGKTIRDANEQSEKHGITSGKYWTYKKEGMEKPVYTQGIPAGKQMFNTRNYILGEGIKKAHDRLVGDMLSKL